MMKHLWCQNFVSGSDFKQAISFWPSKTTRNTASSSRGLIWICHGLGEHVGRYDEIATYFSYLGFDVAGTDLPGHGRTRYEAGHSEILDVDSYVGCIKAAMKSFREEGPLRDNFPNEFFSLGHSLGGLLLLKLLIEWEKDFPKPLRAFVSAPPLAFKKLIPALKLNSAMAAKNIVPTLQFPHGEFSASDLSYDVGNVGAIRRDKWMHTWINIRHFLSLTKAQAFVNSNHQQIDIPVFLAVGSDDITVDATAVRNFYDKLNVQKRFLEIPGAKHEVLNELHRDKLYQAVASWIC